jgi:hypothetical protein
MDRRVGAVGEPAAAPGKSGTDCVYARAWGEQRAERVPADEQDGRCGSQMRSGTWIDRNGPSGAGSGLVLEYEGGGGCRGRHRTGVRRGTRVPRQASYWSTKGDSGAEAGIVLEYEGGLGCRGRHRTGIRRGTRVPRQASYWSTKGDSGAEAGIVLEYEGGLGCRGRHRTGVRRPTRVPRQESHESRKEQTRAGSDLAAPYGGALGVDPGRAGLARPGCGALPGRLRISTEGVAYKSGIHSSENFLGLIFFYGESAISRARGE